MKRYNPDNDPKVHDLVIVGGGIYGAAMAYTAALNGLDAVLLEKDDFTRHTSANSQKVIHGGLRYLQSMDIRRVVESIKEKQRFYHLFPHLVKPLPCMLPTTGYTMKGNEAFRIAFFLYAALQKLVCRKKLTRNLHKKPAILSKKEVAQRFPHMANEDIRGGALWYDGICEDPERVIIALLLSSAKLGCPSANYMKVTAITRKSDTLLELKCYDKLKQAEQTISAKKVALCTGSWFQTNLAATGTRTELAPLSLIRGINLVVPALFHSATSFATKVSTGEKSSRFLFIVPWKGYSNEGTHWEDCDDPSEPSENYRKTAEEFHNLTQGAINHQQQPEDVKILSSHVGYVPGIREGKGDASERILPHYKLVDLEDSDKGDIFQVVGVKFTTAFDVVQKALAKLFPARKIASTLTFNNLPAGSPAEPPETLFFHYRDRYKKHLTYNQCAFLFQLLGTGLPEFVNTYTGTQNSPLKDDALYRALTRYCVKEEMAVCLDDLIFRRIFPDTPAKLSQELLNSLAKEMAGLLQWPEEKRKAELARVMAQQEKFI